MSNPVESLARPPSRRFKGPVVALGLVGFIVVVAMVAQVIHVQNIRARYLARRDAEAAEAAETAQPTEAAQPTAATAD